MQLEFGLGKNKIESRRRSYRQRRKPHKPKLLDQLRDDDAAGISKGDAQRFDFCNIFNVVTFVRNVLREDRSSPASGEEAALDQSAVAVESGFLFDEIADFRFAVAHGLRERAMPESLGMLEPGHCYFHDRWRPLHARVRVLRRNYGKAICA